MTKPKIVLIAGPTASGKSGLALEKARILGGTVINTDAMQVYAGMPILSAQPDASAQAELPHELYGVLDPCEASSAGKWRDLALSAIARSLENGRIPIMVGGTGLYFRTLLGGLADIPPIPDEVRAVTQELYDTVGEIEFRQRLNELDPVSASRLARNDRQRLVRAFEVVTHSGRPLDYWHKQVSKGALDEFEINPYLVMPRREDIYAACDKRFVKMMEGGAIDEVGRLIDRKLPPTLPVMKILGVKEITAYLNGVLTKDQAIVRAQQMTRNYAKRQMTWFRNQWPI